MIDFRYHLISIVAVLLALSVGIVAGSGFLGGPLLDELEERVDDLERKNEDLLRRVRETEREAATLGDALSTFEDVITDGVLTGREVVVWQMEGTDGALVDAVEAAVDEAGGEVVTTFTLSTDLELTDLDARAELTTALQVPDDSPADVRAAIAELLGDGASAAGDDGFGDVAPPDGASVARFENVTDALIDFGYLGVESDDRRPMIPSNVAFVVACGSSERPNFNVASFLADLARGLSHRNTAAVIAEADGSPWGVAGAVRDAEAADSVSTVDNANTSLGRISLALALADGEERPAGHYGMLPDADAPAPSARPGG